MDILLGDDYTLQATITDVNGEPVTPTSQSAKLYDPNNTLKDTKDAPTLKNEGIYWATLDIPTAAQGGKAGVWTIIWTTNVSGIINSEKYYFKVRSNP